MKMFYKCPKCGARIKEITTLGYERYYIVCACGNNTDAINNKKQLNSCRIRQLGIQKQRLENQLEKYQRKNKNERTII